MLENSCRLSTPVQGTRRQGPPNPGGKATVAAHTFLPTLASGTGGPCASVTQPGLLGQMNLASVTLSPTGKPRKIHFPQFKP